MRQIEQMRQVEGVGAFTWTKALDVYDRCVHSLTLVVSWRCVLQHSWTTTVCYNMVHTCSFAGFCTAGKHVHTSCCCKVTLSWPPIGPNTTQRHCLLWYFSSLNDACLCTLLCSTACCCWLLGRCLCPWTVINTTTTEYTTMCVWATQQDRRVR
jgi:hypothetical protein